MKKSLLTTLLVLSLAIAACEKNDSSSTDEYYPEPENLALNEIALNDSIIIGNTQFTDDIAVEMLKCNVNEAWYMYECGNKRMSECYDYIYDSNGRKIFVKYAQKSSSGNMQTTASDHKLTIAGFYNNGKYVLYLPVEHMTATWGNIGYKSSEKDYKIEDNYLKCGILPGLSVPEEPTPLKLVSVEKDRLIFDREIYVPAENKIYGYRHVAYKKQYKNLSNSSVNDDNFR